MLISNTVQQQPCAIANFCTIYSCGDKKKKCCKKYKKKGKTNCKRCPKL